MAEFLPASWTRSDGTPVSVELLNFPELVAAHQLLESGQLSAEDTPLLLSAIGAEIELRWRRKTVEPRSMPLRRESETKRAA